MFELVLDNAKMQIHCNDAKPPPPPLTPGDYELAILPTSTTSEGTTSPHSPFVVGSGNVLLDNDDATYGWVDWHRTVKGVYPLWNTVDPHTHSDLPSNLPAIYPEYDDLGPGDINPAWVNTIAFRFRAKAVEADAVIGLQLFANVSKLLTNPAYGSHNPLSFNMGAGVWHNFEWGFTPSEYATGGWAPNGIQSALNDMFPGYLYARTVPLTSTDINALGDYNVQISEQYMVLYYTIPEI